MFLPNLKFTNMKKIYILDTTLRDGAQTSSVSFTVQDKLTVFKMLEDFGIDFIEAGWPGANDIDTQVFNQVESSIKTAFCMTSKVGTEPKNDENLKLVSSLANNITMVGKVSQFHVREAIGTKLEKNLESIAASVKFFASQGKRVIFDAEHFFDGFKENVEYTLSCVETAWKFGAEFVTLCDTNGGTLPDEIFEIVTKVKAKFPEMKLGIHTHNDCECAVANTIAAVKAGCEMVQGTINGLGERCGNASLTSILPILVLKLGFRCGKINENIHKIAELSRKLSVVLNEHHNNHLPFAGASAFAHKGGLHASAVLKNPKLYEQIPPELVGNKRKILISNQAGKSNVVSMLADVGITNYLPEHLEKITKELKKRNSEGYSYENADASFYILCKHVIKEKSHEFYKILSYKTQTERLYNSHGKLCTFSEGVIKIECNGTVHHNVAEGNGPVDSIHNAMRKVLIEEYPQIQNLKLHDYKVRIIDSGLGTSSKTLVLIEFMHTQTQENFTTVGVSENIIEASFQALNDGIVYFLDFYKIGDTIGKCQ